MVILPLLWALRDNIGVSLALILLIVGLWAFLHTD
jgi:hypothetical protein